MDYSSLPAGIKVVLYCTFDMLSAEQLYWCRPLCRSWPLENKVRSRVLHLGCGRRPRRGCRAGDTGARARDEQDRIVNINNAHRSAVWSYLPVIIGNCPFVVSQKKIVRERYLKRLQRVPLSVRRTSLRCAVWNVRSLSRDTTATVYDSIVAAGRDVFEAV